MATLFELRQLMERCGVVLTPWQWNVAAAYLADESAPDSGLDALRERLAARRDAGPHAYPMYVNLSYSDVCALTGALEQKTVTPETVTPYHDGKHEQDQVIDELARKDPAPEKPVRAKPGRHT